MSGALLSRGFGLALAALGLVQALGYSPLVDSPVVQATLLFPVSGLDGILAGSTMFLVGTLCLAAVSSPRS